MPKLARRFSSTSGEFSDDDVKQNDKNESSKMKWNKQFMKYSSRPWTIYKQASSIVVFTWTVG
ncbi:hypothetical protein Pmar_PMAR024164 [Perkinsus marinus ATCC 50983]|uniref:Uncharacterized protein n=1 Tax=Perkinsus marinus (strain ATCC 50983 / TXsc) TaxID=423536 RepID=C5L2C8_PERM5|nr:hypothetical protein Pmar_PMAR024164 [Perkinsus marinus ATCC 50983]EER09140.1 hypothetical protein Pmar_PMAR024164 [Perkinsus marinus ATCC 50983]|eukprot:XP_002777324.1 hypothetical protein Pmar_PMAR024164 [Perkinsus marinus ATCC 50983]